MSALQTLDSLGFAIANAERLMKNGSDPAS